MPTNTVHRSLLAAAGLFALTAVVACASNQGAEHMRGSVLDIKPEMTTAESYTLKVFFHNTSKQSCDVVAYEMRWEGGEKRVELKPPLTVAGGKKEYQVVTVGGVKDEDGLRRSLKVRTFCKEE